jgi:RNA recognition motif-containing protein
MPSKVFVGNLDFKATRDQIESLFSEAGEIQDVFIPVDRDSGRPRGFAFVEFGSEESALKAIEMFNDHDLGGRALRVNMAEERQRRPRPYGGPTADFSGFGDDRGGGGGGGGGGRGGFGGKPKGSRRNIRGKKRSL